MKSIFRKPLLKSVEAALGKGEQVILIPEQRGFSLHIIAITVLGARNASDAMYRWCITERQPVALPLLRFFLACCPNVVPTADNPDC
jgi:hypothetical protein